MNNKDSKMIYELIIIGGGPAAVGAGVYAARKKIKTLLICDQWGGQSKISPEIQNFVGIKSISGFELAKALEGHLKFYSEGIVDFNEGSLVTKVSQLKSAKKKGGPIFQVKTNKGKKYQTKSIIVASGAQRRKLKAKGSEKFEGKGISYCASCDAPLFRDKVVAVIGGGNAGFETAQQLLSYAKKIYILEYGEDFKADPIIIEKVLAEKKVIPIKMGETIEIKGENFVNGLVYLDRNTKEKKEIEVNGIFVEIGSLPNTEFIKDLVKLNKFGEIIIDHKTCQTSLAGIWAAGDVIDQPYKQNNIAIGDGIKALEDLYLWLQKRK